MERGKESVAMLQKDFIPTWDLDKDVADLKELNELLNDELKEIARLDYLDMMTAMRESYEMAGGEWE